MKFREVYKGNQLHLKSQSGQMLKVSRDQIAEYFNVIRIFDRNGFEQEDLRRYTKK